MLLPLRDGTGTQVGRGSTKGQATQESWSLEGKTEPEPLPKALPEARRGNPIPGTGLSFKIKYSHPGKSVVLLCNLFAPQFTHL